MYRLLLVCALAALATTSLTAQCDAGEVEITMNIYTDDWGYETYWEITESGAGCGVDPIIVGGNDLEVGCTGGGDQDATGGNGYNNNTVIAIDPFCLTEGSFYDLHFVDDWGDGGLIFEIFENGLLAHLYFGGGTGNVWTFEAGNPGLPDYDSPCGAVEVTLDGESVMLNNENAIASLNEVTPGGGNCALYGVWCEGGVSNSVWAMYTAVDDGGVVFSTCNAGTASDTQIAVYAVEDCNDQSTFELITSNDDIIGGCGSGDYFSSEAYASCLQGGTTYYIQIDGWNGSAGDVELTVSSYEADASIDAIVNNISCALNKGEPGNGAIQPFAYGWGSNFMASWTGPNDFTSTDNWIYNLDPGTYSVTITNACGEDLTGEWTISDPEPFSVNFDVTDAECAESYDGSILVNVGGATPGYEIFWQGPDEFTSDQYNLFDLDDGSYEVTITDSNGCTYEQSITIDATNALEFDLGPNTTICIDEQLTLIGPAGYFYEWQDASINQFFVVDGAVLGTGIFSFILHAYNDEGCEYTNAIIITVDNCSSVEEFMTNESSVYPNPTSGEIFLQNLPQINSGRVEVLDARGKTVYSERLTVSEGALYALTLDVAEGLYVLRLFDGERWASRNIVVSR
jgi:hypothetical protein